MLARIEASLERFRIHVDSWALQSELERELPELLEKLDTYDADGAVWLRATAHGADKDYVLIRSAERGGLPTYEAADVVYLRDKLERGFDRVIYVLGADHHGHMQYLKTIASALGYDPDRVEVLIYQLVHLIEHGAAKRASKRRGDVVDLDELLDQIGVDAARWYLVNRGPDQTIEIDVDLARETSEKNQVYYVQYAHARIAGILRNAGAAQPSAELAPTSLRARSADCSSASSTSLPWLQRRPRGVGRTRSPSTPSAWPTTSIASTTATACSAARRRASASVSAGRRRR